MSARQQGTVKTLKPNFGFIKTPGGEEYFFHAGAMEKTGIKFEQLQEGDSVEFDAAESAKGPRAVGVRKL